MWKKEIVVNALNKGQGNAKTYDEIWFETGIPRRIMRHLVEDIMCDDDLDICIGNMQDGRGYFIFDLEDPDDCRRAYKYVMQEEARAYSRLRSIYKLKGKLRALGFTFEPQGEGERFRKARKLKGLSLRQVSDLTGIGAPELSKIETNAAAATAEQRQRLSAAYGIEL